MMTRTGGRVAYSVLGALVGLAIVTASVAALAETETRIPPPAQASPPAAQGPLWSKQCVKPADPKGQEVCFVQQLAIVLPQNAVVLKVALGRLEPHGKLRMILTAPLGIFLPPGLQGTIDHAKPFTLPLASCDGGGCQTAVDMDEASAAKLRDGKLLTVRYVTMERKAMDIPIKLEGLAAALKTLAP